jgi:hypothetical protein
VSAAHEMRERTRDERIIAARGLVKMRARKGIRPSVKLQRMALERLSFESPTTEASRTVSSQ